MNDSPGDESAPQQPTAPQPFVPPTEAASAAAPAASRWRWVRGRLPRGRGAVAASAIVALLLVGSGGFAVGRATGDDHRGGPRWSDQHQFPGREGHGDRNGDGRFRGPGTGGQQGQGQQGQQSQQGDLNSNAAWPLATSWTVDPPAGGLRT